VLGGALLDRAAGLAPQVQLRSLDAIHLAAAQTVGDDLRAIVTYDRRMADAAGALGLVVQTPA
jgi:predicted nucleic acid-binding protein